MFAGRPRDFGRRVQAPITADVERQLKQLVAKFGPKKVREALDPLIMKCKWNDWQCTSERDRSNSSSEMSSNSLYRRHATLARPYASITEPFGDCASVLAGKLGQLGNAQVRAQVVLLFSFSIRTLQADLWCNEAAIQLQNEDC